MFFNNIILLFLYLIELGSSLNSNRKFQTGKQAKQQMEELNRRKQSTKDSKEDTAGNKIYQYIVCLL